MNGEVFDERKERTACTTLSYELEKALKGSEFQFTVGWHLHRHSLNSLLVSKGMATEDVMALVGHRTKQVHLMYRHPTMQKLRDTMKNASLGGTVGVENEASAVVSDENSTQTTVA